MPTTNPTLDPTTEPSLIPTTTPSHVPTATPTTAPSRTPTTAPTAAPTPMPTTRVPTTPMPTVPPSIAPNAAPTSAPSRTPTLKPAAPTASPVSKDQGVGCSAVQNPAADSLCEALDSRVTCEGAYDGACVWSGVPNQAHGGAGTDSNQGQLEMILLIAITIAIIVIAVLLVVVLARRRRRLQGKPTEKDVKVTHDTAATKTAQTRLATAALPPVLFSWIEARMLKKVDPTIGTITAVAILPTTFSDDSELPHIVSIEVGLRHLSLLNESTGAIVLRIPYATIRRYAWEESCSYIEIGDAGDVLLLDESLAQDSGDEVSHLRPSELQHGPHETAPHNGTAFAAYSPTPNIGPPALFKSLDSAVMAPTVHNDSVTVFHTVRVQATPFSRSLGIPETVDVEVSADELCLMRSATNALLQRVDFSCIRQYAWEGSICVVDIEDGGQQLILDEGPSPNFAVRTSVTWAQMRIEPTSLVDVGESVPQHTTDGVTASPRRPVAPRPPQGTARVKDRLAIRRQQAHGGRTVAVGNSAFTTDEIDFDGNPAGRHLAPDASLKERLGQRRSAAQQREESRVFHDGTASRTVFLDHERTPTSDV